MERGERELLMGMSHLGIRVLCVGYFFQKCFSPNCTPPPTHLPNWRTQEGGRDNFLLSQIEGRGKSLRRHLAPQPPKYKHNLGFLALASPAVTRREKSGKEKKQSGFTSAFNGFPTFRGRGERGKREKKTFGVNFPTEQKRTKTQKGKKLGEKCDIFPDIFSFSLGREKIGEMEVSQL